MTSSIYFEEINYGQLTLYVPSFKSKQFANYEISRGPDDPEGRSLQG